MNLPNKLTVARCILALVFVVLMSFERADSYTLGLVCFAAAAATDFLDGYIARSRGLITNFGKLLDPVADKVLVIAAFVVMTNLWMLWVPVWGVVLILFRELLVTGARGLAASEGAVIAASTSGKIKTVLQMGYVLICLSLACWIQWVQVLRGGPGEFALWLAHLASLSGMLVVTGYTVYSGVDFARQNWKQLGLDSR